MTPFQRKLSSELDRLSDEELIEYAIAARDAEDHAAMQDGLAMIGNRRLPDLIRRALIKLPESEAEDLASLAMSEAVMARFAGSSVGEFIKLIHTILSRRIADFYEKRKRTLETTPLPEEHRDDDDDSYGRDAAVAPDETSVIGVQQIVDELIDELSEEHRRVIDLYVFADRPGQETADAVNAEFPDADPPMSVDNVQKIASRFRHRLRKRLEGME